MLLGGSINILFAQQSQDPPPDQNVSVPTDAAQPGSDQIISQAYIPLTLGQNYLFTADQVAGPGALFAVGIHGFLDEALNRPHQWGTGEGAIGLRIASDFGRRFLRQNIAFGVRALDHEDPRYFRSGQGNLLTRVRYATVHTFLVRNDHGSAMPAYSLFISSSTMPFIAQSWRPEPFSVGRGFAGDGVSIGFAMATNMWNEFWPDLRANLPRKLGGGMRTTWFTLASSDH
ncbi:MAG TPA: hypothetical protein VK419_02800 [Bryobacteraceae bacterium]|nr:hypothetical protein [Bryobacteraceae bacterium]